MFALILLLPTAHAERGWFARTFGPADADEDGIPDRRDECPSLAENLNDYADEDGCPDHLSFVTVQAQHNERNLTFAEYFIKYAGKRYVANGPAMTLEDLPPGSKVEVAARYACLNGESKAEAGVDPTGVRLKLYPSIDRTVSFVVTDDRAQPVDTMLEWVSHHPMACAPVESKTRLPGGRGVVELGAGTHEYLLRAKGGLIHRGSLTIAYDGEAETVTTQLQPKNGRPNRGTRMPQIVYFLPNRDRIESDAVPILDSIALRMADDTSIRRIIVEGHADYQASSYYNENLAARRADAVRNALIARGVAPERLATESKGEEEPAESGYSAEARALSRRVEFVMER